MMVMTVKVDPKKLLAPAAAVAVILFSLLDTGGPETQILSPSLSNNDAGSNFWRTYAGM